MSYTINEIKEKIAALPSMCALNPEDFSEEGGLADCLVYDFDKKEIRGDLKITQLRKVFNELKSIYRRVKKGKNEEDNFDRKDVSKLLTMLAYSCGRELIPKDFYEIMKICITEKIKNVKDFRRFVELLSAVIAYYKLEKA